MHLLPSKRNSSLASVGLANQSRSPLNMHRTESLTPRKFSLDIISLSDRWSVPNFRRSSLSTHASPGVSMLQGAKEHEEGRSKRTTTTRPSSLRNQFKKFTAHLILLHLRFPSKPATIMTRGVTTAAK